jgi:hypothetical protein
MYLDVFYSYLTWCLTSIEQKCDHFQLLRTVNSNSPKYKLSNDMKFSRMLDMCTKIQRCTLTQDNLQNQMRIIAN